MTIGINAAAAMRQPRTGVEEYTYQLIKHLTMLPEAKEHRFLLYMPAVARLGRAKAGAYEWDGDKNTNKIPPTPPFSKGGEEGIFDFPLPENFILKKLRWPLPMWTQLRLSAELLRHQPDVLFIPAHVLPLIHPKNSVVSVLGLEFEYYPETYSFWRRQYLRYATRYAVKNAKKIIAISENTKRDLIELYGVSAEKIKTVYLGINDIKSCHSRPASVIPAKAGIQYGVNSSGNPESGSRLKAGMTIPRDPYLLYLGRIETKKNIQGILDAYKILKEKYRIPHQLVLAGPPGYGYKKIKLLIQNFPPAGDLPKGEKFKIIPLRGISQREKNWKLNILELGYVTEQEKQQLLAGADIFLFPSFYEGFGIPILEAQAAGAPVVSSNISSMPQVAGRAALLVNPKNPEEIAQAVYKIIDDSVLRDRLIQLGYENVKKFSWKKCARETLEILLH